MSESEKRVICWDLDETLGHFTPVGRTMMGEPREWDKDVNLMYGVHELLSEFSEHNGFFSFITTSGTRNYADKALRVTGLRRYFSGVYGRGTIVPDRKVYRHNNYKNYEDIAWRSIPYDQYPAKMLVVGDSTSDSPVGMPGLVSIIIPNYKIDAMDLREVIVHLLEKGNGDFNRGFHVLQAESKQTEMPWGSTEYITQTPGGVGLRLRHDTEQDWPLPFEEKSVPLVFITSVNTPHGPVTILFPSGS